MRLIISDSVSKIVVAWHRLDPALWEAVCVLNALQYRPRRLIA